MVDVNEKSLADATAAYTEPGKSGFSKIEMLLKAAGGLSLSQVCAVTGLEGSTIQNWVKRGWVPHPTRGKKYEEVQIARILIVNALKECIKLEHIAILMSYIKGSAEEGSDDVIKESQLYNHLCDALQKMGQAEFSRGGVESVVEVVIKGHKDQKSDSYVRIRKALTLMIYACVCTDVKRRTETMMRGILNELEHPEEFVKEPEKAEDSAVEDEQAAEKESEMETRKTVSQALREWDISSVEGIIIDHKDEQASTAKPGGEEKRSFRPWYSRKGKNS